MLFFSGIFAQISLVLLCIFVYLKKSETPACFYSNEKKPCRLYFLIRHSARPAPDPACVAESEVWLRPLSGPSHSPELCSTWPLSERCCA